VRLPSGKTILVADTVGFIRDLPHSLIDAFRATLEEICQSSLILLVLDAGAPDCLETFRVVTKTLGDIGAGEVRRIVLLNKTDTCREEYVFQLRERIAGEEDVVLPVSAVDGRGVDQLLRYLDEFFQQEEKP
jgi:GTP-binding protein HflX